MTTPVFYTVNENELSFRVMDGEAVIISAGTGYYYSLNRSGTVLWHLLLDGGRTADAAAESLAAYYVADVGAVSHHVENVLAMLLAENLVRQDEEVPARANGGGLPSSASDHPYEQPQLIKFDRLQRLMVCGE